MIFKNSKVYDVLKYITLRVMPAVITFLSVVLPVLEIEPKTANVALVILGAAETLLGTLIGISSAKYNKEGNDADNY